MSEVQESQSLGPSLSLLKGENWERIGKYVVLNTLVMGVIVSFILMYILFPMRDDNPLITGVLSVGVVLMGMSYTLNKYEQWRGCQFIKNE